MGVRRTPHGRWELQIRDKLLPGTFYQNYATEEEALSAHAALKAALKAGRVPASVTEHFSRQVGRVRNRRVAAVPPPPVGQGKRISHLIEEYRKVEPVAESDEPVLDLLARELAAVHEGEVTFEWVGNWVAHYKAPDKLLKPSTIRKRVGSLARVLDWRYKSQQRNVTDNPLRQLRKGYSSYNGWQKQLVAEATGEGVPEDTSRNRRLEPGEHERILAVTGLTFDERAIYLLALETAMRMRELYTLRRSQLFEKSIHLDKTKNGDTRQVPLSSRARKLVEPYRDGAPDDLIFPWWDGHRSTLDATTAFLSKRFLEIFRKAQCADLVFHDLRHEATCRFFLQTSLSDTEISKITGHRDPRMLRRYTSLRGSELADRLG